MSVAVAAAVVVVAAAAVRVAVAAVVAAAVMEVAGSNTRWSAKAIGILKPALHLPM